MRHSDHSFTDDIFLKSRVCNSCTGKSIVDEGRHSEKDFFSFFVSFVVCIGSNTYL